jgi:hypothetical protein
MAENRTFLLCVDSVAAKRAMDAVRGFYGDINEIDWTPRGLPCYLLERMEMKHQFRSATVAHRSSDRCVFGISSTGSMPSRSKRIPTAVTILIARITMKAETG